MTYSTGSLGIAYLTLLIPLLVSLLLWVSVVIRRESYYRRFQGWRLAWEMWLSSILFTGLLFGAFYWYLFWQPFYTITIEPNGSWSLQYVLPARDISVVPTRIQMVALEDDWLPTRRAGRRQIVRIQLQDGLSFTSGPLPRLTAEQLLQNLNAQLRTVHEE